MGLTRLISGLAAAAGAMLALASSAPALGETQLKMNNSLSQNSHYGVAVETFARVHRWRSTSGSIRCISASSWWSTSRWG